MQITLYSLCSGWNPERTKMSASPGKGRVVLAYSGGLDTSVILRWLMERGHDVIAYVADVGQSEDFSDLRRRALAVGAVDVVVDDLREEFVTDYIFPIFKANALYEGR